MWQGLVNEHTASASEIVSCNSKVKTFIDSVCTYVMSCAIIVSVACYIDHSGCSSITW